MKSQRKIQDQKENGGGDAETIDLHIIDTYSRKFAQLYESIEQDNHNKTLTLNENQKRLGLRIAAEYYKYLTVHGVPYGDIALSIVQNRGLFGTIANRHLERQARFNGVPEDRIRDLRTEIALRLAYRDAQLRRTTVSEVGYASIAAYHVEEFRDSGAGAYAWGGLLFEKVLGSGSWMSLHDATAAKETIQKLVKLQKEKLIEDEVVTSADGGGGVGVYSTRRMLRAFVDAVQCSAPKYVKSLVCPKDFEPLQVSFATTGTDPISEIAREWDVSVEQVIKIDHENKHSNHPQHQSIYYRVLPGYAIVAKTPPPPPHRVANHDQIDLVVPALPTDGDATEGDAFKFEILHVNSDDETMGETKDKLGSFLVRLRPTNRIINIGQYPEDSDVFLSKSPYIDSTLVVTSDTNNKKKQIFYGYVRTKTLKLSGEQYRKILKYLDASVKYGDAKQIRNQECDKNIVVAVGAVDSAILVQNLYHAAGLPLFFTLAYSERELMDLKSTDGVRARQVYGSRDQYQVQKKSQKTICGDSREHVAEMLNLDVGQVNRVSKLQSCVPAMFKNKSKADGDGQTEEGGTKTAEFSVKIDQELLDSIVDLIDDNDDETSVDGESIIGESTRMRAELNELFSRYKIPPSGGDVAVGSDKDGSEPTNPNKDYKNFVKFFVRIEKELSAAKDKLDELLRKLEQASVSVQASSNYTEKDLLRLYKERMSVIQQEFNRTQEHNQNNPGLYKYEAGERLPGGAAFDREQAKITEWVTRELQKIKGAVVGAGVGGEIAEDGSRLHSAGGGHQEQLRIERLVDDWNKTMDGLRRKFNDDDDDDDVPLSGDSIRQIIGDETEVDVVQYDLVRFFKDHQP